MKSAVVSFSRSLRPSVLLLVALLTACASLPVPEVRRAGPDAARTGATTAPLREASTPPDAGPQPVIRRGDGQVINRAAAAAPPPSLSAARSGSATFNFEGESLHAVVKAILGDMLGQNYVIAPGVSGTVTLGTPKPVSAAEALNLLEMVLGWNNARLVYSGGRYNVVPADQPLAGAVAPRGGTAANARGYELRVVPLRFISASEMKKVLEPYARANAIVGVDNARNVITLGGSRTELENYLRTVEIFDVDWLSGMSVGVFPLHSGRAERVAEDLEKVFGEKSGTPVAGMFRFLPLDGANAVMVITPQATYLDEIRTWLDRIDGAGAGVRLYSHELRYIKARDLALRLAEVFGAERGRGEDGGGASLLPGTTATELSGGGLSDRDSSLPFGVAGQSGGIGGSQGSAGAGLALNPRVDGNAGVTLQVEGDRVGVSAVEETNTLLVRASPMAWSSIREVIERLDVMPMQVHIEAQVVEVALEGNLSYGVNWFFENAVVDEAGLPSAAGRTGWSDISGSIRGDLGLGWTFLGRNAAAIIEALDEVTDVRMLQTPSVMVRNNAEAVFNVGSRIPVSSVSMNPGLGGETAYTQVQYLDTGTILKVRPRVTRDGMVFLDIVQEVSAPEGAADQNGNVRINTKRLKTEAAIRSGDTVLLAGLIEDTTGRGSSGVPFLSRLPVVGALFGTQSVSNRRSEVIVLLTATSIADAETARALTDEYGQRFRALEPLQQEPPRR